jgi:hypothetical protein
MFAGRAFLQFGTDLSDKILNRSVMRREIS